MRIKKNINWGIINWSKYQILKITIQELYGKQ